MLHDTVKAAHEIIDNVGAYNARSVKRANRLQNRFWKNLDCDKYLRVSHTELKNAKEILEELSRFVVSCRGYYLAKKYHPEYKGTILEWFDGEYHEGKFRLGDYRLFELTECDHP